jgi:hypothetical protein
MLSQLKPFFAPEEPIVGEWYYYMGAEKGGLDTEGYWEKGVLAKFRGKRNYDTLSWEFSETTSPNMPHPGSSNKACAFRKATKGELIAAGLMYPLTPEECFSQLTPPPVVPEKWSVRITAETKDTLEAFMRARRDEFVGYEPTWKLTISNGKGYFNYPQSHKNSNATYDFIPQGYKEVELKQILHVLTDKNQTKINLNTEKDGKHIERNTGTTIKVQRPDLSVNRGSTVRATGIRCPGSKITIGSGHSPNQGRSCKG